MDDAWWAASHSCRASPRSRSRTRAPHLWTFNSWTSKIQHGTYHGAVSLDFDPIAEARRNWERHGWPRPDAMVAATSIARAQQILIARVNAVLSPFGLTFSRFEALALLFFSRRGALPMGKMGARLQVHPTSVTNTVEPPGARRAGAADGVGRRPAHRPRGDHPGGPARRRGRRRALGEAEFGLAPLGEGELRRSSTPCCPCGGGPETSGRPARPPGAAGLGRHFCLSRRAPTSWARRAAERSPSAADTIEPFIRMCHWRANSSGSATPASAARPSTKSRIRARWSGWRGAGRSPGRRSRAAR